MAPVYHDTMAAAVAAFASVIKLNHFY